MGLELGHNRGMMPIHKYQQPYSWLLTMPNGIAGVAQCDLSHKLSPSIAYKKGAFLIKNTVYSHPASAILYSPPERNVIHIDIYQSKRKNNVCFIDRNTRNTTHKSPAEIHRRGSTLW